MYFLWAGIWKGIGVRPLGNAKSALRLSSLSVIVSVVLGPGPGKTDMDITTAP